MSQDGSQKQERRSETRATEIRYEGPIRASRRAGTPEGGARFVAAALLAAAVVVLLGVAWLLSGDREPPPPPTPGLAQAEAPPAPADPLASAPEEAAPPPREAVTEPEPPAAPSASPAPSTPSPVPLAVEPAGPAPTPSPAPRPSPAPAPAAAAGVGERVRAGDLEGACRLGRERAEEAARRGDYTLQVLSATDPATVRQAFDRVRDEDLVVVSVASPRGSVYRLLWGFYPSVQEAKQAAASCPSYFPRSESWPYAPSVATALAPVRR